MEVNLVLLKCLQMAGFRPVMLIVPGAPTPLLARYYAAAGVHDVHCHDDIRIRGGPYRRVARALLDRCDSLDELVHQQYLGVSVGRIAASTAMKQRHLGSLDLRSLKERRSLENYLCRSMRAVAQAERILAEIRPDLVLLGGPEYTPTGELFELCVRSDVDTLVSERHRSHALALMLKRYGRRNLGDQLASLSSRSWEYVRALQWTDEWRARLDRELTTRYAGGGSFDACLAHSDATTMGRDELLRSFGLDPAKKTAVILRHSGGRSRCF